MKVRTRKRIIADHHKEQDHLHRKAHEVTHHNAQRHDQTREIDFSKDVGIVPEYRRCLGQAIGKVIPSGNPRHVKQGLWKSVCTESCQVPKDKRKDDRRKQGLNEEPQGS